MSLLPSHRVDVKALRERYDLTQADIADSLYVDLRTVRRWEKGNSSPSPMALAHLRRLQRQLSAEREQRRDTNSTTQSDTMSPARHEMQEALASSAPARRRLPSL